MYDLIHLFFFMYDYSVGDRIPLSMKDYLVNFFCGNFTCEWLQARSESAGYRWNVCKWI